MQCVNFELKKSRKMKFGSEEIIVLDDDLEISYPFKCTICPLRFSNVLEAKEHFETAHENAPKLQI